MKQSNISIKKVALTFAVFAFVSAVGFGTAFGYGGSSGGGAPIFTPTVTTTVTAPTGQVLGAESFNFTTTLKIGVSGDAVVQLQNRLATDGYTLVNDGKFGPKTKAALIKWQKAHSLTADGVVGPKTRAELNK